MDGAAITTSATTKQFDFSRHWRRKVAPLLDCPDVALALTLGLKLYDPSYEHGDPPWEYGRGPINGQRAKEGCLSWYQPWGRCHYIAPFCWAVGRRLLPELEWGFLTSHWHSVVIGWDNDWRNPRWVLDILLFRDHTAEASVAFVKSQPWAVHRTLREYLASFSTEREAVMELLRPLDAMFPTKETCRPDCGAGVG